MRKKQDITQQEKQYVIDLRLYERAMGKGGRKTVTKQFWARLGDKVWQTANTRQLKKLIDRGYLKGIVGGNNTTFYSLTKKGIRTADLCIHNAHEYEWDIDQHELMEVS